MIWVDGNTAIKLLGVPFELSLTLKDFDSFLQKIKNE